MSDKKHYVNYRDLHIDFTNYPLYPGGSIPIPRGGRVFVGTATGTLISIATGDTSLDGWSMRGGGPEHNGPRNLPLVATKTAAAEATSGTK